MDPRNELLREEAEGWAELSELLARLDPKQMEQHGLSEDWTVKDLLAHLEAWLRDGSKELNRIHLGTYEPTESTDAETDAANREIYEAFRDTDLETVRRDVLASRARLLEEFRALPELTAGAKHVFRSEGPEHYHDHMEDLRRFVERVSRA
ncbi:MAG: maleylpyruvate isomerase N-terminal domain-containing protein [Actinomycetota bacterium]